jgi:hypothetical protein
MRRASGYRVALLIAIAPAFAVADQNLLTTMEGYYSVPGRYCSELQGTELRPCMPPSHDCLLVKELDMTSAGIEVSSTQTNGHQCSVSGRAQLKGGPIDLYRYDARG